MVRRVDAAAAFDVPVSDADEFEATAPATVWIEHKSGGTLPTAK